MSGKTELQPAIIERAKRVRRISAAHADRGRNPADARAKFPATELWRSIAGERPGDRIGEITLVDLVGFAIEDFSALYYLSDVTADVCTYREIDLLARSADTRDLFGVLARERAGIAD